MSRAFVFPGQGSQKVGMGTALAEAFSAARQVFEEVDDALEQKLFRLMAEGPSEALTLTANTQPALMASSLAVLAVLESEGGHPLGGMASMVAGHSLGEYSALVAAGALPLADTARLLRVRGEAMQQAVPVGEGAMAAVLGLDLDVVSQIVEDVSASGVCAVANDNSPGQVVISGAVEAVEKAAELATERGAKRAMMLPVSAPFHCPLMQPAAERMAEALENTVIGVPAVPVMANVSAEPVSVPETIRKLLVDQVTATVRWREGVLAMKQHDIATLVELGTGKVLTGLTRRIDGDLEGLSVETPADVEAILKTF